MSAAAASAATAAAAIFLAATGVGACGGANSTSPKRTQTITVLMGAAPDSLDPGLAGNREALEADWLVYTPLLTYVHAAGVAGTQVVAGLASGLPVISDGGRTYTLTLRPGLVYSNGRPVRAGDFAWAVRRAIKLGGPPSRELLISRIRGAGALARGATSSISGITTDDAARQITIRLSRPDGSFENVLALPALAPVPRATPLTAQPRRPPPGVGPYTIAKVLPGRSFSLVVNRRWGRTTIPGLSAPRVNVRVRISRDVAANARSVLAGRADVFDWADPLPSGVAARLAAHPLTPRAVKVTNQTYLILMDATRKPFSSPLARQAVATALDATALSRLDEGGVLPGCYLLAPGIVGHPSSGCPHGDPAKGGDVSAATALLRRSGMVGAAVRVQHVPDPPFAQWTAYYISLLNQIGFKARIARDRPQSGIATIDQLIPNPTAFYEALRAEHDFDDPHVTRVVRTLRTVPAGELSAVQDLWQDLDEYLAAKAYVAVIGYRTVPELISARIDPKVIFNPAFGYDWSSFRLR